jgi:hypothetical protein
MLQSSACINSEHGDEGLSFPRLETFDAQRDDFRIPYRYLVTLHPRGQGLGSSHLKCRVQGLGFSYLNCRVT